MIYSSIVRDYENVRTDHYQHVVLQTPIVYMTRTLDGDTVQTPIPFTDPPGRYPSVWGYDENFGIWSCRFSADGTEVVAGGNGNIFGKLYIAQFDYAHILLSL
jgi:hypothetical protein